jgi:hypothetical protein
MTIDMSEKVFGNFMAILDHELDICGCIELNHEFLRKVGYQDLSAEDMPEFVDMIRKADKGSHVTDFHVVVNENGGSPRYFVYSKIFTGGAHCGHCDFVETRTPHLYAQYCNCCTLVPCPVAQAGSPGVRKLF